MSISDIVSRSCVRVNDHAQPMTGSEAEGVLFQLSHEWQLKSSHKRIFKHFTFDDYSGALAFVNEVAKLAEAQDHHPDIKFGWGYVDVEIWTHKIGGLHMNDFVLAAKIQKLLAE